MFEVSVRTIYRDIDSINQAGIPVITYQGAHGGIGLMEGYRLDRNVLTDRELAHIFTALQSVSSYGGAENALLMEKISSVIPPSRNEAFRTTTTQLVVDFSPWGLNGPSEEKIAILKDAIEQSLTVAFEYASADGQTSSRSVEPYTLVLKGQAWYLYGFCTIRQDFRLFKLLRMKGLIKEARQYVRQELPVKEMPWNNTWKSPIDGVPIVLHFPPEGKHLAEDRFDTTELQPDGNGGYIVSIDYPEDQWLYGFLLSFGNGVEVLQPEHIRCRMGKLSYEISTKYNHAKQT